MVSKITDKILPQVKEWQSRPLNPVYPFVFMDCIHYKVREDGRILSCAAYVVLGVTVEGYKDILSITVGANETSKFWLGMLNDLKKFSSDFKAVYNAPNETAALSELENIKEKWGKKYPYAVSNWENNWEDVSSFFQFSNGIRRIMYTTNIIEGLNRQYRKVTKTKSLFPSDTALEKMLYLASENEWICSKADHSRFLSIPSAFVLLPEFPYSIPEVGCGQRPRKNNQYNVLFVMQKNQKMCIKPSHMVIL